MQKILIIDHNEKRRFLMGSYLERKSFGVHTSHDGSTGIKMAMEICPDLIICNANLPKISGFEYFKLIKKINFLDSIPFIFISSKLDYNSMRAGMEMGADDFLLFHNNPEDLLKSIKTQLKKKKYCISESESKLLHSIGVNGYGIFVLYQDTGIVYCNPMFLQTTSYSMKELYGISPLNICYKDDIHQLSKQLQACFKGLKSESRFSFRMISKKGSLILLESCLSSFYLRGEKILVFHTEKPSETKPNKKTFQGVVGNEEKLTRRESEVLELFCQGYSNLEIAEKLFISERTVEGHKSKLYGKTGAKNSAGLIAFAIKNELVNI